VGCTASKRREVLDGGGLHHDVALVHDDLAHGRVVLVKDDFSADLLVAVGLHG
jgi:hypothetical protein